MQTKNKHRAVSALLLVLMVAGFVLIGLASRELNSYADSDSLRTSVDDEVIFDNDVIATVIQQTAYSYYMRGPLFQYNSKKGNRSYIAPEEASSQNMEYTTCSAFVSNVYYDLFGEKIVPAGVEELLDYGKEHIANPEVVMYAETNSDNSKDIWINGQKRPDSEPALTTNDLLPYLKTGDILTYYGHTMMVYDLIYEGNEVVDAVVIQGNNSHQRNHIATKMTDQMTIWDQQIIGESNPSYAYYNKKDNRTFSYKNKDGAIITIGREEGGILLSTFKTVSVWRDFANSKKEQYSILRFLTAKDDKPFLISENTNVDLTSRAMDRLKFNNIYIEKTVNVFADSVVVPGDELTYTIIVKNNSGNNYAEDILVSENISNRVIYKSYESNKTIDLVELSDGNISWNIGKLASGEQVTLSYTVGVKEDAAPGEGIGGRIESTGFVGRIPSTFVKNYIRRDYLGDAANQISSLYDELSSIYNGKQLIDQIYQRLTGKDLKIADLDITTLFTDSPTNKNSSTMDKNHELYNAVLPNYFNSLYNIKYESTNNRINEYEQKWWRAIDNQATGGRNFNRRADTIYEENFKTGDILIYRNHDDNYYEYDSVNNNVNLLPVTRENGEYAYIYIDGRGFVGVNFGDNNVDDIDNRNDFNYEYYSENGDYDSLYVGSSRTLVEYRDELPFINNQTLFGKDYYVILRPSMVEELSPSTDPSVDPEVDPPVDPEVNPAEDPSVDPIINPDKSGSIDDGSVQVPNTGTATKDDFGAFVVISPAVLYFMAVIFIAKKGHTKKISF